MAATGLGVIRQMVEHANAHDLEGMAALMHGDYQSEPFDLRAITQFTVQDGLVVTGRLFAGLVEQGGADINASRGPVGAPATP